MRKYYNDLVPEEFTYKGESLEAYIHYNENGDKLDFQFTYKEQFVKVKLTQETEHIFLSMATKKCEEIDLLSQK